MWSIISALLLAPLLTAAAAATSLTFSAPAAFVPSLPSSTVAHLTTLGRLYTAPVDRTGQFRFQNLSVGSYLLTVHSQPYAWTPLKVDIGDAADKAAAGQHTVRVFKTVHGIEWDNKGVELTDRPVELQVAGRKNYYAKREGFSPLSYLKNPMILVAVVGMGVVFGMPYLLENMDPEMREEFEEQQKKSILTGGAPAANPLQNFDMAAWMAGTPAKSSSGSASGSGSGDAVRGSSQGGGSKRRG